MLLEKLKIHRGVVKCLIRHYSYSSYHCYCFTSVILICPSRTLDIKAIAAGVKVGIGTLVGMRLRRVSPRKVIGPLIKAHKAGLNLQQIN